MSNIKKVKIEGKVPFDTYAHEELNKFLGQMNAPCFGFHIHYGNETFVPNEYNGQTALYDFEVTGEEAVRTTWLERFLEAVVTAGGSIKKCDVMDIEAPERIHLAIPAAKSLVQA